MFRQKKFWTRGKWKLNDDLDCSWARKRRRAAAVQDLSDIFTIHCYARSVVECASPSAYAARHSAASARRRLALWATPVLKLGHKIPCQHQKMWQYIVIVKPIIARLWENQKSSPI
jgi:hypothetical protein